MENNRDRKGIFLGVISVATLIVAIIGATFAYFSATITANEEVNFTAYTFSATASVEKVAPSGDVNDLIPVDGTNVIPLASNTRNDPDAGTDTNGACKDLNGYSACIIYKVTVNNGGSNALSLTGEFKTIDPGDYTHLKIMPASFDDTDDSYTATGDAVSISSTADTTVPFTLSSNNVVFTAAADNGSNNGDTDFYFIIYLDNVEGEQNAEMGETFTGQFVFSSADGGQLKATIQPVSP